ncbi:malonyl-ACP O-methyltransferase BioC [Brevibacillus dissolubilis]|uniref:malonyl-ACP O-methyltransferase BioC n=1 Tax=Brevibacillus dissolubilis TaxID=1844116 RepID=UPI001116314B|nr:malonyl-ACP O-methyltransferase BioC [Brevibacillus dissolubilis]
MKWDKQVVSRRFSDKADTYDQYATVQKQMAHQLVDHLRSTQPAPARILEIGCGTGYLTKLMLESFPHAAYTAIDLAEGMITESRGRFESEAWRCTFICADAEEWVQKQVAGSYDLIVSSACFQWFVHPDTTMGHLQRLLTQEGRLAFTTFGPRTFHELHTAFQQAHRNLSQTEHHHGIPFLSLADWQSLIQAEEGRQILVAQSGEQTQYFGTVKDFLYSVKQVGANHVQTDSPARGLGERRILQEMMRCYDARFRTIEGIPATYETILIVTG